MTALARRFANPVGAAVALLVALMTITVVVAATPAGDRWNADVQLFHHYAGTFLDGFVSRTPFLTWYPPLSLVPITLPRLVAPDLGLYSFVFALEMSAIAGIGLALSALIEQRWAAALGTRWIAWTFAGLVMLAGFVLPWRFDIVPAVLVLAAVLATLNGNAVAAGALLGLGAALKIYPAVLLPAVLAWFWTGRRNRDAAATLAAFLLVGAAGVALYLFFPPATPSALLQFQSDRGLQIESLPGSLIALGAAIGLVPNQQVIYDSGSFNLVSSQADAVLGWLSASQILALLVAAGAVALRAGRERAANLAAPRTLVLSLTTLLLVLMLTNKVLSIQYMIWILPLTALMTGAPRILGIAAAVLTAMLFPFWYDGVLAMSLLPVIVLVARNLALVALLGGCFVSLVRGIGQDHRPSWGLLPGG